MLHKVTSTRIRHLVTFLVLTITACGVLSASTVAKPHSRHHSPPRVGGRVHRAWPHAHGGKAPRSALARWLARQVGPTTIKPCRHRVHGRMVACHRRKPAHRGVIVPKSSRDIARAADIGSPDQIASAAAATSTGSSPLQLVRSYSIPTDDPSYTRLLNWSWTYDSAITATAFSVAGDSSQAEQLLDQLAALQHTDGSIEIAFNVADGTAESVFRSGTIASVGLAGSLYDQDFHTTRYVAMEERAANYLLTLQGTAGLIRGGPDVTWYSTQHNLLAYAFFELLGTELTADGNRTLATTYFTAASKIATGIESNLLVHSGSTAYFIEGLGDSVQSLDADALGVMYLESRGETSTAQQVMSYAQSAFAVSGRSIVKSTSTSSYNNTYSAKGPFSGFAPYLGSGAPNVLWTEGSAEMLVAATSLGQSSSTLAASLLSIAAVTPGDAPVMADQTLTSIPYGAEYHVWPSAAAGAWMLIALVNPAWRLFG
ncbi:MAG: hypothetical protein JO027_07340 [Solirubrobacterales bacterium]|nr:hypothetical protein [Solirubrobacterales bacterium]